MPTFKNYTGDSTYLFLGANATISPAPDPDFNSTWIDLSGLPTVFNGDGFAGFSPSRKPARYLRAPLATLLVCNPNLAFMSRNVVLQPTTNLTDPDITVLSDTDIASPHNIHQQAARTLFTAILHSMIRSPDPGSLKPANGSFTFNWISATMFLNLSSGSGQTNSSSLRPLDQQSVNPRMDKYTLSALKAFTSGYQGPESEFRSAQGVFARMVKGQFTSRKLALSTSFQFAILHSVLFGVLALTLAALAHLNKTQQRRSFDLKYLRPKSD